jgi:two-component system, LytTR family, sensor kinase
LSKVTKRSQPLFLHPVIFIGAFVVLGFIFALQSWVGMRLEGYKIRVLLSFEMWGMQFLLWGTICWLLWWRFRRYFQEVSVVGMFTQILPLSIVTSVMEEMIWVLCFPNIPLNRPRMTYWQRVAFQLDAELVGNVVIFWCAFFLFRGVGYYQKYREKEDAAAQLEVQLANAKISALRMQLNPHFLFNTMNSISSLIHTDPATADVVLEQLASLLRITLERGDMQLIPLSDEIEFIELYLAMQEKRFAGRVHQALSIDPALHDALIPAMILQPIVENAYSHGFSKLNHDGSLFIEARKDAEHMKLTVLNSGVGFRPDAERFEGGKGVGLTNVRSRLRLHYGEEQTFSINEVDRGEVQVTMTLPLQFAAIRPQSTTRYGA